MKSTPGPSEIAQAEKEIQLWGSTIQSTDHGIRTGPKAAPRKLLPVRGAAELSEPTPSVGDSPMAGGVDAADAEPYLCLLSGLQRRKLEGMRAFLQIDKLTIIQRRHKASKFLPE